MTTKQIRIRVCIDEKGNYRAGGTSMSMRDIDSHITESMRVSSKCGKLRRWAWITADVPLPETEQEIQGRVE